MDEFSRPIDLVVDRIAAALAKAWDAARAEGVVAQNEDEAAFLRLAYRYLTEREAAVFKLERERHVRDVANRYQPPPDADDLYGSLGEYRPILEAIGWAAGAFVAIAVLLGISFLITSVLQNLPQLLEEFWRFLGSGSALVLLAMTALPLIVSTLIGQLFARQVAHAFARLDGEHWLAFQQQSSEQLRSERAQILAMVGPPSDGDGGGLPERSDPDLPRAREAPVPILPGVAEYLFKSGRVTVGDLGADFRHERLKNAVVFWVSFAVFLLCVLGGVAAALLFKQDFKVVGGIGLLAGVIGAFNYGILGRGRAARIAVTLFDSYVIEFHERLAESETVKDVEARRRLRTEAFSGLRVGMNELNAMELKSIQMDKLKTK